MARPLLIDPHRWDFYAGAEIYCIKKVAKTVELDGAATSDASAIIVERKQTFRYRDVEEFVTKIEKLK